jgi:hypothetical protein
LCDGACAGVAANRSNLPGTSANGTGHPHAPPQGRLLLRCWATSRSLTGAARLSQALRT